MLKSFNTAPSCNIAQSMVCQDPAAELQSTVLPGVPAIPNKGQTDLKQLMMVESPHG